MINYEEPSHRPVIIVGEHTAGEQNPAEYKKDSNASVTSMVLGILSLIFCWIPYISFFMALIGLILGIVSLAGHRNGHNMAVAGVILSVIGILLSGIAGVIWLLMFFVAA